MTRKYYRTGILLALISLTFTVGLSACKAGPVGIFASIAQETDINKSRTAAFDDTSPDFVGMLGANYYTIINGTIWTREVSGGAWGKLATMPTGVSNGTASSAATIGGGTPTLYVTFGQIGDSAQKVWATTNGSVWVTIDATFSDNGQIDSLLSTNNELFAVTRVDTTVASVTTTSYSVYHLSGGFFVSANVTGTSGRPTSMAYDGTDYWLTAGHSVYSGGVLNFDPLGLPENLPDEIFAGVAIDPLDANYTIFTTSSGLSATGTLKPASGRLYRFNGINTWSSSSPFEKDENPHAFSAPAIVDDGTDTFLLVGTVWGKDAAAASGYLEFDITGGFNPAAASASTDSGFADIVNFQT